MEQDNDLPAVDAAIFHTTHLTVVMGAARNQTQWGYFALTDSGAPPCHEEIANRLGVTAGGIKTLIHRLRKRYSTLFRGEVRRTVSDPAEIVGEIHSLCEALIASEGRLGP